METQDDLDNKTDSINLKNSLQINNKSIQKSQDHVIEVSNDDSISFHLNQNTTGVGETPFVNKIADPFGDSLSELDKTPMNNPVTKNLFGSLIRGKQPSEMFKRLRLREQQAQMMEYESQSQADGVVIDDDEDDDEEDSSQGTFKLNRQFLLDDTQRISNSGDTQVISNLADTQQVYLDTQLIESDPRPEITFDVPSTQLIRRSIEVPSTVEKKSNTEKPDLFDEITSQQTNSEDESAQHGLNFAKSSRIEIGSDDEIENTTVMYELIELDKDDDDEEFRSRFQEDSLGIYDQLKLKKRQFSDMHLHKKPKLTRTRTDFSTPSRANWTGQKSSPSTEILNSSPSMVQLQTRSKISFHSSPTSKIVTDEALRSTLEIVSSKHSSDNEDAMVQDPPETEVHQVDETSPLTSLEDSIYRGGPTGDKLTRNDIINYSSIWARIVDKFYPTMIKKLLRDGVVILHEGKQMNLPNYLNIFPLDIKVGDKVKIFNRRKIHCVTGLSTELNDTNRIQCIRGFDTVYVMPCTRNEIDLSVIEDKVLLSDIYLVNSIWTKRDFISELDDGEYHDSLVSQLPNIRGRHSKELLKLSPHKNGAPIIVPNLIPSPVLLNDMGQVFRKCCFSITSSTSTESQKQQLRNMIIDNGGKILENGLFELFNSGDTLAISNFFSNYKFGLCISLNGYSRSAKYLEALLLGWPILSERFIIDVLDEGTNLNNFESYLLPAGESNLLGTVKSLNIYKFMSKYNQGMLLSSQIDNNFFLQGYQIYQIMDDNLKLKNSILQFLFKCMGIQTISQFDTLTHLKTAYNKLDPDTTERTLIFISEDISTNVKDELNGDLKIIDWEWVVQCVISGMKLKFK